MIDCSSVTKQGLNAKLTVKVFIANRIMAYLIKTNNIVT